MDEIKKQNLDFWTINVPYCHSHLSSEIANSSEFWEKADEERYRKESYFSDIFPQILKPSQVSLEVGCGSGNDLRTFSRAGLKVFGLDYSPESAYLSKVGLQACRLEGEVVSGDAECLPFPDDSFDLVYSWGVLHHTPNTQKGINEIFRVLRPGGKTLVMLYHKGYQYWYILASYIFRLKWLKNNLQDYISLRYDRTPLSQMFSCKQIYNFFRDFEGVSVQVIPYSPTRSHPVLKYLWRLFISFPWLMRRFASFGVITAYKPGKSPPAKSLPEPCCPICQSTLVYQDGNIKCGNQSCAARFFIYKGVIPILHPLVHKVYEGWLKNNQRRNIRLRSG